jgi:hypothetical protein
MRTFTCRSTFLYDRGTSHRCKSAACPKCLYGMAVPVGRRRVISSFKLFLPGAGGGGVGTLWVRVPDLDGVRAGIVLLDRSFLHPLLPPGGLTQHQFQVLQPRAHLLPVWEAATLLLLPAGRILGHGTYRMPTFSLSVNLTLPACSHLPFLLTVLFSCLSVLSACLHCLSYSFVFLAACLCTFPQS